MIKKLFKDKFFASTFLLLTGGAFSKILGFILKIFLTRTIGIEGVSLYSLLSPTYSLLVVFAILSFPVAISKLVAEPHSNSKKIIFSIIPVSIFINLVIILLVIFLSKPIAVNLLKEERLIYPIICIGFTLPFIGLSSIIKGYFWGKQRMLPYILSNIGEQILRLVMLTYLVPKYANKNIILTICIIILINIFSETFSIIIMMFGIPKNRKLYKEDFKIRKDQVKNVMGISIPSTSSKIIGNIMHFFEPVIITNILLYKGYNSSFILKEYGIINGYVLGLLLIPQFFTQSISTALIPELSKNFNKNNRKCKKRIFEITLLSFIIGITSITIIYFNPQYFLNLIYKTNEGVSYIKLLSPFIILYFINMPLYNSLDALGASKEAMKISISSGLIKLSVLSYLLLTNHGMNSLIYSIIVSLFYSTYKYIRSLNKILS